MPFDHYEAFNIIASEGEKHDFIVQSSPEGNHYVWVLIYGVDVEGRRRNLLICKISTNFVIRPMTKLEYSISLFAGSLVLLQYASS